MHTVHQTGSIDAKVILELLDELEAASTLCAYKEKQIMNERRRRDKAERARDRYKEDLALSDETLVLIQGLLKHEQL
jgi:hypothetical protein